MTATRDTAPAADARAALPPLLTWGQRTVEPALRAAVDALPAPARTIAGYHLGWCAADGTPEPPGGGKALRATFAMLSAGAVGAPPQAALPAAVAVELVHNFSLLHDDVMDRDVTRRHRPTAWTVFGESAAILTGDALLSAALASVHDAPADVGPVLARAVQDLILGQFLDLSFEAEGDVALERVARMADLKTGALFGAACGLGARCGGGAAPAAAALSTFGQRAGRAFQVRDDVLGIWGAEPVTGKPSCSDLRSGKKSFPVVAALRSATPAGAAFAALHRRCGELDDAQLEAAAALAEEAGARRWCDRYVADLLDEARCALRAAGLAGESVAGLVDLAAFVGSRPC